MKKVKVIDNIKNPKFDSYAYILFAMGKEKGITLDKAKKMLQDPMYFGLLLVYLKEADGLVGGITKPTAELLRAAFKVIGTKGLVSAIHFILTDKTIYGIADTAVVPDPNEEQLAEIAVASAETYQKIVKKKPKVALLSFSTKGSASWEGLEKIRQALKIAKKKNRQLTIDGELQLDAAVSKEVAKIKAPKSVIKGDANVLIVPNLSCGNILYKALQRIGNLKAIGPVLQNMNLPINDLSRGASVEEIVELTALTVIQAQYMKTRK